MPDIKSKETRSYNMSIIKSIDTTPERDNRCSAKMWVVFKKYL